ncbi:hypothetical protein GGX14DRAFT_593055 [Mycena pura]|uniref:HAT C-terminal dimerisation domain-containing protein n=1 Tax=Mycena pura TaxID=153505 RepID=A0AAD6UVX5_9AGAR|nr:hypothetical protein GGX14DRAFT_593055 [Mycena pura]
MLPLIEQLAAGGGSCAARRSDECERPSAARSRLCGSARTQRPRCRPPVARLAHGVRAHTAVEHVAARRERCEKQVHEQLHRGRAKRGLTSAHPRALRSVHMLALASQGSSTSTSTHAPRSAAVCRHVSSRSFAASGVRRTSCGTKRASAAAHARPAKSSASTPRAREERVEDGACGCGRGGAVVHRAPSVRVRKIHEGEGPTLLTPDVRGVVGKFGESGAGVVVAGGAGGRRRRARACVARAAGHRTRGRHVDASVRVESVRIGDEPSGQTLGSAVDKYWLTASSDEVCVYIKKLWMSVYTPEDAIAKNLAPEERFTVAEYGRGFEIIDWLRVGIDTVAVFTAYGRTVGPPRVPIVATAVCREVSDLINGGPLDSHTALATGIREWVTLLAHLFPSMASSAHLLCSTHRRTLRRETHFSFSFSSRFGTVNFSAFDLDGDDDEDESDELDRYFSSARALSDADPVQWWYARKDEFPRL